MRYLAILSLISTSVVFGSLQPETRSEVKITYDGYHVYSVRATSKDELATLEKRLANYHTQESARGLDVAVPPNEVRTFNDLGLDALLVSNDLGAQIQREAKPAVYKRDAHKSGELPDLSWYDTYHNYTDHLQYWDDLVAAFPKNSEKTEIGKSYEGRPLYAFHFFGDKGNPNDKPVILWHSTVHAREWITTMVIEYWAWQLINGYTTGDKNITEYLDYYDILLVPFHNADGFVYTQTTDRMWRKNRQPRRNTTCIGTDLNRNWKFEWGGLPGTGAASTDPCDDTFQGRCPGDTPENHALDGHAKKLADSHPKGIRSYIDLHSYGQKLLTPYGFTCNASQYPPTLPRMLEVAGGYAEAVRTYDNRNTTYRYGTGCDIEYYSAGNGRDHMYGVYGADHSWTLELDPVTTAQGGFVLPPEQILPVVKEQWAAQQWLLSNVWEN